jgi:hypothetical protein
MLENDIKSVSQNIADILQRHVVLRIAKCLRRSLCKLRTELHVCTVPTADGMQSELPALIWLAVYF